MPPKREDYHNDAFGGHFNENPDPDRKQRKDRGVRNVCLSLYELLAFHGNYELYAAPLVLFNVTAATVAVFWRVPSIVATVACFGIFISLAAAFRAKPLQNVRSPASLVTCFIAIFIGILCGGYAREVFLADAFTIALGRTYSDILASSRAAAYADAGALQFADTSTVDASRSVGFQDGRTYCAAPVVDSGDEQTQTIGFWAVGLDCCNARGDFLCGDAGDKEANGGVVLAEGSLDRTMQGFLRAVNQSVAVSGLILEDHPLLIQWAKDPGHEQRVFMLSAIGVLAVGSAFVILQALIATSIEVYGYNVDLSEKRNGHNRDGRGMEEEISALQ